MFSLHQGSSPPGLVRRETPGYYSEYLKYKLFRPEIRQTESIANSEEKFKELANFQFVLAKAVFKEGLSVPVFLRQFIYDFDRIDDVLVKKKEFEKIKSGYYNI